MPKILLVALVLCALPALAQPVSPIYPSYEGFAPNEDGTFTLVFGYYSANTVPVTIPPGESNGFLPDPDDRGQPTLFQPGRQRNVCRIVVGPELEGRNFQWTIEWGGEVQTTTERGGPDPLYLLEEVGSAYRATREIDTATAERGVCINGAPTIFARTGLEAVVGEPTAIRASIVDDGLPRGSSLTIAWTELSGPGEVTIAGSTTATPTLTFAVRGSYEIQVSATDGEASREQTVTVTVVAAQR